MDLRLDEGDFVDSRGRGERSSKSDTASSGPCTDETVAVVAMRWGLSAVMVESEAETVEWSRNVSESFNRSFKKLFPQSMVSLRLLLLLGDALTPDSVDVIAERQLGDPKREEFSNALINAAGSMVSRRGFAVAEETALAFFVEDPRVGFPLGENIPETLA
jgi:hypothetical protein